MKINWDLIIDKSDEKLHFVLFFSWDHKHRDTLQKCLFHLETMVLNRGENIVCEIYKHTKPMSLKFSMINAINGNIGDSGEIIYTDETGWKI